MGQTNPQIQRLVHQARNDLNVIAMGLQTLCDLAGSNSQEIDEIKVLLKSNGLRPLQERLDRIDVLASDE